jgi:hypothetical protein
MLLGTAFSVADSARRDQVNSLSVGRIVKGWKR